MNNITVRETIFFVVGLFTGLCVGFGMKFAFNLMKDLFLKFLSKETK